MRYLAMLLDLIFKKPIESPKYYFEPQAPFNTEITVEYGTTRYTCAVDSLMTIVRIDNDQITFSDMGNLEYYIEYIRFVNANKKAIQKEENRPYKY